MGKDRESIRGSKKANGLSDSSADAHDLWRIDPVPIALLDSPLDFLLASHSRQRQVSALLMMIANGEFDRLVVKEMVVFLEGDFLFHFDDEEIGFFPLLRQYCPPEDNITILTERLVSEHAHTKKFCKEVIVLLKELLGGGKLAPEGAKKISAFAEDVRQHLAFENSVLLPIARVRLNPDSLLILSALLKDRRNIKSAPM